MTMQNVKLWDLPIRIFHWGFSVCLALALLLAFVAGEHSPLFPLHMLFGLSAGFLLVLRVVAGMVTGGPSRPGGLFFKPGETLKYLIAAPFGKARRYAGHNPGTAMAALIMFIALAGLVASGLAISTTEEVEELHEVLAFVLMGAIVIHIAGIILHTIHHREAIALSMITGLKQADPKDAIQSTRPVIALLMLAAMAVWTHALVRGYDRSTASLTLPGLGSITLGEEGSRESHHSNDDDHDAREDD